MPPGSQRTTRPTRRVRVRRASCPRMCRNVPEIPSTPGGPLPSVLGLPDRSWKMGVSLAPRSCWGGDGQTPGSPPDPAPLKGSPRRSPTLMPLGPAGAPSAGRGHAAPARRWAECPLCFQDLCSPGDEARHPGPPRQTRPRLTPCSGSKGLPLGGGRAGGEPRGETPCVQRPSGGQAEPGASQSAGTPAAHVSSGRPQTPGPRCPPTALLTPRSPIPAAPAPARGGLPSRQCGRSDS